MNAIEASVYVSNEQELAEKLKIDYGIRYSAFFLVGKAMVYKYSPEMTVIDSISYRRGELVKFYNGAEPRVEIKYLIDNNNSLKASYTYVRQYQHLISNSSLGLPTDIWLPATTYIKPQYANQFSIGYYRYLNGGKYDFFCEIYYRCMNRIIDFKDNAEIFLNKQIETQLLRGSGEAYGSDFYIEKKEGNVTGWISYSLSKVSKRINGINNNKPYPATYDKRHNLSVSFNYRLTGSWNIGSVFKITSGGYATIPEGSFTYQGASFNYYSGRNGFKLPLYHRLDLSFTYKKPKEQNRKFSSEINFGIYNLYGRKNVFALFARQMGVNLGSIAAYRMYIFTFTPFFSYNINF